MLMFTQMTLFVSFNSFICKLVCYKVTFTVKLFQTVCYECESSNFSECTVHPKLTFVKDVEVPMVSLIMFIYISYALNHNKNFYMN